MTETIDIMIVNPPKGMRDFSPEEAIAFKEMLQKIEETYQEFGFDPMFTPVVEYWETLKGKYGEEAENKEIWRFKLPQSDKWYALRYDHTVPLARYIARYQPKLPFKRYVIDRVYRHDRPQRGRFREFWQADIDTVGSDYPESDAEIINAIIKALKNIGLKKFTVRVNDRRALESLISELGYKEKFLEITRIIDKWDKIGEEEVRKELEKVIDDPDKVIASLENPSNDFYPEDFWEILDLVENKKLLKIDLRLARGLDYYTKIVFEVDAGFGSTIAAGGRYDNLIGIFLNKNISAVGGSIGVSRLFDYMVNSDLISFSKKTVVEIAVVYIDRKTFEKAWEISNTLRDLGFKVYIDLMQRDFKKQIEYCVGKDIRYLIIVGERDLREGKITFQDRKTKTRVKIPLNNLDEIKNYV